jgi:superfamily II DNA helicase RecQ
MARTRPTDAFEMLQVSGVGEYKLRQYGKAFMDVVASYIQGIR